MRPIASRARIETVAIAVAALALISAPVASLAGQAQSVHLSLATDAPQATATLHSALRRHSKSLTGNGGDHYVCDHGDPMADTTIHARDRHGPENEGRSSEVPLWTQPIL